MEVRNVSNIWSDIQSYSNSLTLATIDRQHFVVIICLTLFRNVCKILSLIYKKMNSSPDCKNAPVRGSLLHHRLELTMLNLHITLQVPSFMHSKDRTRDPTFNKKLIRRWDSERELQQLSSSASRGFRNATEFVEITQNKGHYTPFKVIQDHRFWYQSKAHIRLPITD